jgi:hypothetical protein
MAAAVGGGNADWATAAFGAAGAICDEGAETAPVRHEAGTPAPSRARCGAAPSAELRTAERGGRHVTTPICALCGGAGEGPRARLQLPHGVTVWLCAVHRDPEFLARRSGRDLVRGLRRAWESAGCLDRRRSEALAAHVRRFRTPPDHAGRPGSYAWPDLRAEAERRFALGETPREVIEDLRSRGVEGGPTLPSIRTMTRWFAEGRWLVEAAAHQSATSAPTAA